MCSCSLSHPDSETAVDQHIKLHGYYIHIGYLESIANLQFPSNDKFRCNTSFFVFINLKNTLLCYHVNVVVVPQKSHVETDGDL